MLFVPLEEYIQELANFFSKQLNRATQENGNERSRGGTFEVSNRREINIYISLIAKYLYIYQ